MPSLNSSQSVTAKALVPRLFVLELNAGRIHSMNTDGSDRKTIVTECHLPEGIVVDVDAGHISLWPWTLRHQEVHAVWYPLATSLKGTSPPPQLVAFFPIKHRVEEIVE
jgi:hypothetical protein